MKWILVLLLAGLSASQSQAQSAIPSELIGKTIQIGFIESREQRVLDENINFTTWKSRIELNTFFNADQNIISTYIAFVPTEDGKNQPQRNIQRNSEGGRKTQVNGRQVQIVDGQNGGARFFSVQIEPSLKTCQVNLKYVKQAERWLSSGIRDKKTFEMRNHQASNLSCKIL